LKPWSGSLGAKASSRVEILLPGGDGRVHLASSSVAGPRLPAVVVDVPDGVTSSAGLIARQVRAQWGLELHVLSFLSRRRLDGDVGFEALVLAEDLAPEQPTPPGIQLAPLADLDGLAAQPHSAGLRGWLDEQRQGQVPAARVPWAHPGWRAEALTWIAAQLDVLGLRLAGPVETRRTWSLSCVLRVPTAGGDYYFKAVPPLFAHEPALTRFLSTRFPGLVPAVAAVDFERRWMLMPAFSGPMLQDDADPSAWAAALAGYGQIQAALVESTADLLALGCPDRRLERLAAAAPAVLDLPEALLLGQPRGLSDSELAALHDLTPSLQAGCEALAALGPPPTLEHGDLHAGNIITTGQGACVYYDWTDGALAHPFICLAVFLERAPAEWHAGLCADYLSAWSAFGDDSRLQQALRLARPIGALHMAYSYRDIWVHTEPGQRWQLAGALPFFLKEVLLHSASLP
jgi:hypothetical protein